MYLMGIDVGTSSIKVSIVNGETGQAVASSYFPKKEAQIMAVQSGWAEQDPETWWRYTKQAIQDLVKSGSFDPKAIGAIGIAYQMHGLVVVDKDQNALRPSIIWCDSRAIPFGDTAFQNIGADTCLGCMLNSPGNFTASKLKWVKENEPDLFAKIDKIMLPGDFIGMKLTGDIRTTISGLSEGIFWDFEKNEISKDILDHFGFDSSMIAEIAPTFGIQGTLQANIADELGLAKDIPVTYRAGDQPNNALSLNVFAPGEVAATAGTSGVIYGVSGEVKYDPQSRVNSFAHVNHRMQRDENRIGVLLCINGTGILNSWTKHHINPGKLDYDEIDKMAEDVSIGSDGVTIIPFGNGAERMLGNREVGCHISNLNFNTHDHPQLFRAAQEGIVCAFNYGLQIMKETGIHPTVIRAGHANLFLSPIFRQTFSGMTGIPVELYKTDGAQGAALGAGMGVGYYKSSDEAFGKLELIESIEPDHVNKDAYDALYIRWEKTLQQFLNQE